MISMHPISLINNKNPYSFQKKKDVNNSDVSFNGLTKQFSKCIYIDGQKDIEKIIEKFPHTKPLVGQLPKFVISKLPQDKNLRKNAVIEIFEAFDKAVLSIRNFNPTAKNTMDEIKNNRPNQASELLNSVFKKFNIIGKFDEINLQYIDKGGKGAVYKLDGLKDPLNEDEFVIKIYHNIKGEDWHPFKSHGCYAETNSAAYWIKNAGYQTQRGKFFFGGLNSGYIVNKFIDLDVPIPRKKVNEYSYGLTCTDEWKDKDGYNRLKSYNYDWGGVRVINRLKNNNKVARHYLHKVRIIKDEINRYGFWISEFYKKDNDKIHQESKRAGLALSIKHFKNDKDKLHLFDLCYGVQKNKIDEALAYLIKYLPHEDAIPKFESIIKRADTTTQIVLLNEIPLLAKVLAKGEIITDGFNNKIDPEKILVYYDIARKHVKGEAIEHFASLVHLLPANKMESRYTDLLKIDDLALKDRLEYKFFHLPRDLQDKFKKDIFPNRT